MSRQLHRCWGRAPVARTVRFSGFLAWLCLASGALALPLSAEEVTVTVPPDSAAQDTQTPAAAPAALPSFTGGDKLKTPAATGSTTADQGTAGTPASSTVVKHKSKDKKAATTDSKPKSETQSTADNTTTAPPSNAAPADATTKPVDKTKQAAKPSPCKGLDEPTCGANKLCSWVVPKVTTPDATGKVPQARCRSLAMLKKEAAKTAKASKPETLPWAPGATSTTPPPSGSASATSTMPAGDATAKPAAVKKTKTASAKKTPAPKPQTEVTPPIPAATDSAQEAPSSTATPAPDPQ